MESKQIEENKGRMALEIFKTVSFIPPIIAAFQTSDPSKTIQLIAEKIRKETGAEFVVIGNKDGTRYSHPSKSMIGKKMRCGDFVVHFIQHDYSNDCCIFVGNFILILTDL